MSNYAIMLRCKARDNLSFAYLSDVWSITHEI